MIASIHELTLVARYTTHVAVMREGRLAAFGSTAKTLRFAPPVTTLWIFPFQNA